jgi:hypothetical protein
VIEVLDATKEEIYPGEPDSIDAGIELARSVGCLPQEEA